MNKRHIIKICSIHAFLFLVLMIIRMKLINFHNSEMTAKTFLSLLSSTFSDTVFITGGAILFIALGFFKRLTFASFIAFIAFSIFNVAVCLINVKMVYMLGGPFNYQWLYYSDFMGNSESKKAVLENLSCEMIVAVSFLCSVVIIGGYFLNRWIVKKNNINAKGSRLVYGWGSVIALYITAAAIAFFAIDIHDKFTRNPVIAFAESVYEANSALELFTLKVPPDFEKQSVSKMRSSSHFNTPYNSKVKNILLFVLESTPAEYVSGYQPQYKVMPNLERYINKSMVFTNIYAHSPSTNNSMVSILSSIYPMISYRTISTEHPDMKWPTISSELKKKKYHTTFYHASDNRFQKIDEFLGLREFDKISDYQVIPCERKINGSTERWKNMDGVDEACMADAFINELTNYNKEEPFFAMLWTMQTHYPYFTSGQVLEFEKENKDLNRYLNALHHSDAVLGRLLNTLEEKGLMESTLIVVTGDHGEAFGRHNQIGHGVHIYEENVHVPLILINPLLFSGAKNNQIGGHIDVVPTIYDILRFTGPKEWQGLSLFDTKHPNRAYFFNPWTDYLFGYRTSDYKVIHNASRSKTMVFDLSKDPLETKDLSEDMPEFLKLSHNRLAHWVQSQKKIQNKILGAPNKASVRQGECAPFFPMRTIVEEIGH